MPLIFRKNASYKEKLYTTFFILASLLAIYGFYIGIFSLGFEPSSYSKSLASPYLIVVGLLVALPILFDKHPDNKARNKPIKKLFAYIVLSMMMSGIFYGVIVYTTPYILISNSGLSFQTTVIITKKTRRISTATMPRCEYELRVKDIIEKEWTYSICSGEEFWNETSVNNQISIYGIKNKYGKIISKISYKKANKAIKKDV